MNELRIRDWMHLHGSIGLYNLRHIRANYRPASSACERPLSAQGCQHICEILPCTPYAVIPDLDQPENNDEGGGLSHSRIVSRNGAFLVCRHEPNSFVIVDQKTLEQGFATRVVVINTCTAWVCMIIACHC
jgi:hypothetical protein